MPPRRNSIAAKAKAKAASDEEPTAPPPAAAAAAAPRSTTATPAGQIAHVYVKAHDVLAAVLFLASFPGVALLAAGSARAGTGVVQQMAESVQWVAWDDTVKLIGSAWSHYGLVFTASLVASVLVLDACLALLRLAPKTTVWVVVLTAPALALAACLAACHFAKLPPAVEAGASVALILLVLWYANSLRPHVNRAAASLSVGARVVMQCPSLALVELALFVPWGMWAKVVVVNLMKIDGGVQQGVLFGGRNSFSAQDFAGFATSRNGALLALQLLVVTGAVKSLAVMTQARMTAAYFFGFSDKLRLGALSALASIVGGNLGTAALLGSVYAAAHYIDEALLTVWRVTPWPLSALVGYVRGLVARLFAGFTYFTGVVAGVRGVGFGEAVSDCAAMAARGDGSAASAALTAVISWRVTAVLWAILAPLSILLTCVAMLIFGDDSLTQGLSAGRVSAPAHLLAIIVPLLFTSEALSALHTATMATLVCVVEQGSADRAAAPGSPAAKRVRSEIEREVRALLGEDA